MPMQPGTIIVLNGTTSSGKTTLLRELQDRLEPPYLECGIDKFLFMLPERYLSRPLWDQVLGHSGRSGELGNRLFNGMHHALAALSRCGSNVLADHVFIEPAWVADCAAALHDLPAYLICVHCPLDVLELRERSRGDRTLGHARAQFAVVHQHAVYDLEIDTAALSPAQAAKQIMQRLADGPPIAFRDLYQRTQSEKP